MQQSKEPSNPQSLLNERRAPAVQHSLPAGPSLSPLSYNVWREQGAGHCLAGTPCKAPHTRAERKWSSSDAISQPEATPMGYHWCPVTVVVPLPAAACRREAPTKTGQWRKCHS